MEVKSIALVGVAGAAASLSFQGVASAYTSPKIYASTLPYKCSAIAQREGNYISSSRCAVSRVESLADFELPELVRMVEFSNAKRYTKSYASRLSSKAATRSIAPPSRMKEWIYPIKGVTAI